MNIAARRYMCGVAGTFWIVEAVLIGARFPDVLPRWSVWLPLLGLAMMAEAFEVQASDDSGGVMSFSAAVHVAAVILLGPVLAALVAAVAVVLVDGVRVQRPLVVAVNSAMFGWASLVAGGVYVAVGGQTGRVSSAWAFALVAVVVYRYAVNAGVYAVGEALATGMPVALVARERLVDGAAAGLGEGSLGVLLAAGWGPGRWVTLPFLVPLFAALYSSKSNFERLKQETKAALAAFARVIDQRHPSTARHTERVAQYVERFAQAIGLPQRESERLVQAAQYHDLGKIAVDEATLSKHGRLSEDELRAIRRHPRLSAKLLEPFGFAREIARYAELHHERYDGQGYYGASAADIPIEAHVLIAADSFDAMTSERSYRPALTVEEATRELLDKAGSQFHPLVACAFVAVIQDRDIREVLSANELETLLGEFERIPVMPRLPLSGLRDARLVLVGIVGTAILALSVTHGRWWRVAIVLALATAIGTLGTRALRERHRVRCALRCLKRGEPVHAALDRAGVRAETRWLRWDANAEGYTGERDDVLSEEVAQGASMRSGLGAARLSDGRYLIVAAKSSEFALAVLLDHDPTASERAVIATVGSHAPKPAEAGPTAIFPVSPIAPPTLIVTVELDAFERVRHASGQLSAARVVRDARHAVEATLRSVDTVSVLGDDQLVITLSDVGHDDLDLVCGRIADALRGVDLPQRVAPIVPAFQARPREGVRLRVHDARGVTE
jgi:hypothetical protein